MRIDHYSFGRITIDGRDYDKDVIIVADRVISPWWRQAGGHVFATRDLADVIDSGAEVVVFGIGDSGLVKVDREVLEALEKAGAEVIRARTARAVDAFNRLSAEGRNVAAALHLTC
jgi:hypothetical protein